MLIRVFSILNLSHSFLLTLVSNWTGDQSSQMIKINKWLIAFRLLMKLKSKV